jgi:hypothetical protein
MAISCGISFQPLQATEKLPNQPTLLSTWENLVFQIEDAKCRVGIASVKLSVSELKPEGGYLVGEYSIVIPLMKSKNDRGRILLPLDSTVGELGENGGVLRGQAISYKEGKTPNRIVCEILPQKDQTILLAITTEDRTINFESRYSVAESTRNIIAQADMPVTDHMQ